MNDCEYLNISAPVFNVQTYCIHDGPGIRTTVFVKGCPLRCLWCANPESNETKPQLMTYQSKCTGCGSCIPACPKQAISIKVLEDSAWAVTDRTKCVDCGGCVKACPMEAREVTGKSMTVAQALEKVLQDKLFFDGSGGGMTISGGEALAHPKFSAALFRAAKEHGVHTAIETSNFAAPAVVDEVYAHVDLALCDIKHMDPDLHRKYTGVSNDQILENIKHIYHDLHVSVIVRVPTIPGFNDDLKNITATARFVYEQLGPDVPIHLLPYHRLGESKTESLGQQIHLTIEVPSDEHMESLRRHVESYGPKCQVGG